MATQPVHQPSATSSKEKPREVMVVGFGKRLGAALIDWIVVAFFSFLAIAVLGVAGALVGMFTPGGPMAPERLMILLAFLIGLGYFIIGWARGGATMGKNMLGLRVVRADGSNLGYGKAILRYIGYIVSGLALSIGFLWINFDKLRQGWHDKFAGSYVVREMDADYLSVGGKLVPEDPGVKWIWIVAWVLIALIAPAALLSSIWLLGPAVSRSFLNLLGK
jgi:uncharacterized RDD family membrane protein YckC